MHQYWFDCKLRVFIFVLGVFVSCVFLAPLAIHPPQDEAISDALVGGLEMASRVNHATRTSEPLVAHLQHSAAMNETEVYGSLKAIVNNAACAATTKDMLLLEWMRHITRHQLEKIYTDMVEALSDQEYTLFSVRLFGFGVFLGCCFL
jgi:hypothetical protein